MKNLKQNLRANLTKQITLVESALSISHKNLQLVSEPELIDYYVYKIKADEAEHRYLLNRIREIDDILSQENT